jgi:hypothetical protein
VGSALEYIAQRGEVQSLFAAEVILDKGAVGMRPQCNLANSSTLEALFGKAENSGFEEAGAGISGFGVGRYHGCSRFNQSIN